MGTFKKTQRTGQQKVDVGVHGRVQAGLARRRLIRLADVPFAAQPRAVRLVLPRSFCDLRLRDDCQRAPEVGVLRLLAVQRLRTHVATGLLRNQPCRRLLAVQRLRACSGGC